VKVDHFTPWDANWPFGPPQDAIAPNLPQPDAQPTVFAPSSECGSIIDCENQRLGESIPITGTPYSLTYNSGRTDRVQYRMNVPVTGAFVPASLQSINVQISIAGRTFTQAVPPTPNQTLAFTWDGVDAYGRSVEGARTADVSVTYTYPAKYRQPQTLIPAFDQPPNGTTEIGDRTRATISLKQGTGIILGRVSAAGEGLGGWTFSAQRAYDTVGRTLYDGTAQRGSDGGRTGEASIYRAAGTGGFGVATSGVAAKTAIGFPISIAARPDGGFYFVDADSNTIYLVDANGNLSVAAGSPCASSSCTAQTPPSDGSPAIGTPIRPFCVAVAPDGTLYFSEEYSISSPDLLRRVANGVLQTVGGATSSSAPLGDGGPVAIANLGSIYGLAFAPDGVLYISDAGHSRVRRVSLNGIVTTIAGGGSSSSDNIPAVQASIGPRTLAVGPDGSVYVAEDLTVVRITPDGFIHYLGDPRGPAMVDGQPAAGHSTNHFMWGVAVAGDGTVILSERRASGDRVWTINGGIAHVLAGSLTGDGKVTPNGSLARAAQLDYMYGVAVAPDGSVLIADSEQGVIEKTGPTFPALSPGASTIIPSDDGMIGYIFENGRHTRSVSTITGTTLQALGYDTNGYLTSITDVDGQVTTIERDASENATAIVAAGGQRTALSIGTKGLTSVTNPANEAYQFDYNDLGLLSQLTDPRGGVHHFTYDDSGRLTKDADAAGGFLALTRSGSSSNFGILRQTSEGRTSTVAFQQASDLLTSRPLTGSDGLVTIAAENGDGSSSATKPSGAQLGNTIAADPRFGMSAAFAATSSIQMPSGLKASVSTSRLVSLANPNDPLSVTSYSNTATINGRAFTSVFTKASRTTTFATPLGRITTNILDDHDRIASTQMPGTPAVTFAYNAQGLLASATAGVRQAVFTYDDRHRLKTLTDPLMRTFSYDYDDADRVRVQTLPGGRQITYSYDANGNVTSITPPSRPAHSFAFTPADLMGTYTPPSIASITVPSTTYQYNGDRQVTQITRPDGQHINFQYDGAGRVQTVTDSFATRTFAYDAAKGALSSISSTDGNALGFAYDGDLVKTIAWSGNLSGTVGFTYDTSFRVISESINGANTISFGYDNDDLLTSAGALAIRRDAATGFVTGTTLANLIDSYGYNSFGEVTTYDLKFSGSSIVTLNYTRDNAGRIAQKSETVNGQTASTTYGYDDSGRLSDVTTTAGTTHYGYDANGNRTTAGSIPATYDDQDRLTTYNGDSYLYSDDGELQKKMDSSGTTSYSYDLQGNLRSVMLPNGTLIEYVIDASNRRVGKKVNGTLVAGWLYSGALRIVAETDGSGTVTKRFVYGTHSNVPEYMIWQGGTYKIVTDQLGSPRFIIEATAGTLAEVKTYDAFGVTTSDTHPGFQPFGFAGGLYDADTGLTRFGARDYDAATGRWTTKDPVGFAGSETDLYAYAEGDPVNQVDPDGLKVYPSNFVGPLQPGDSYSYSVSMNDPRYASIYNGTPATRFYYPPGTPPELQHECVSLTKAFTGAPCTACWRMGPAVRGNASIPVGAAIAAGWTENGRYPNSTDNPGQTGNSGIYVGQDGNAIYIIDQFPHDQNGHPHPGRIRPLFFDNSKHPVNNGNQYHQIIVPKSCPAC
jgi:RHS repeat-associated protein